MSRLTGTDAKGLLEAYSAVYAETEQVDENLQDVVKGSLDTGAKFMKTNPVARAVGNIIAPVGSGRKTPTKGSGGYRPVVKDIKTEEINLFDYILEYLVAEGYADTNQNAIAIMSNMSEEWRESIVGEEYQEPKFGKKEYIKKLSKRGGMGMGTSNDPHGYRDPKMAKVGAELSARKTAAAKAKKTGEPDTYRAGKEAQSKRG